MDLNNLREDYNKNGYVIIDNFLPNDDANKLEELYYHNKDWKISDQIRDDLYSESHFQSAKTKSKYLPKENESYSAKFWSSDGLVSDVGNITHLDQWVSSVGCLYYINRDWIWDWGGIFHLDTASEETDDSDSVIPIFPKFNRALIINNTLDKFKFPHFVSHVTDYAMNPRFTLVTFGKESR